MIQSDQFVSDQILPYEKDPFEVQKQDLRCFAMAINSDNNLLVVGACCKIKVIEITNNSTFKELQLLKQHQQPVLCLNFFTKNSSTRSFISVADTIIIYFETNFKWDNYASLRIEQDISQVKSLVIHPQEDLFICGSQKTIQFWFQNLAKEPNEYIQDDQSVWTCKMVDNVDTFGLSINQQGDRLISCSREVEILVMKGSNTTEWSKLYTIKVNSYGLRLCFITNDVFAFQERGSRPHDQLRLYSLSLRQQLNQSGFNVKGGDQSCNSLFPLSYVPSKQLIIDRNGDHVNVVSIKQDKSQGFEAKLVQDFQYKTEYIYGTVSQDGNLLILWDEIKKEIQLRRFNACY